VAPAPEGPLSCQRRESGASGQETRRVHTGFIQVALMGRFRGTSKEDAFGSEIADATS
jgi:hypothetical protein